MSLYAPNAETGYVHSEAPELDRKLREGDGILWTGDPRLELRMGILKRGRKIAARRYEVWRHNEDGTDEMVGHWLLEEFDRILMDLAPLRLDSPGHVDSLAEIDKHNDAMEAAAGREIKDQMGEALSHMLSVWHDRHFPKNRFRSIPGQRTNSEGATWTVKDQRASAEPT